MSGIKEENERKKEYLMFYLPYKRMVENAERRLEELKLKKMFPGMNTGDGFPGGSRITGMADYMASQETLTENILKKSQNT